MKKDLTKDEEKYVEYFLSWREKESKQRTIFYNACLIAGGIIILSTFIYLIQNLEDSSIYWIGIPGVLISIPFFIVYSLGMKMVNEKNIIASIIEKLKHKSEQKETEKRAE